MNMDIALGNGCFNTKAQVDFDAQDNYFCILPETCKQCKAWDLCAQLCRAVVRYYNKSKIREAVK